jgi:hypothetical protein
MIQFNAAPAVPSNYPRLKLLTQEEIDNARIAGYVADEVDPQKPVKRAGLDNYDAPVPDIRLQDWRTRMCLIWFCYIYENFQIIPRPLYAVEELILEFKGLDALDPRLASLYAGAGGWEPASTAKREKHLKQLKPNYTKAIHLLDSWGMSHVQT